MARCEPYWARYLPSWRSKDWSKDWSIPVKIKIKQKNDLDSSTFTPPQCEGCSMSCNYCPYSQKTLTS